MKSTLLARSCLRAVEQDRRGAHRRHQRHDHHHREQRRRDDAQVEADVEHDQLHQAARVHQRAEHGGVAPAQAGAARAATTAPPNLPSVGARAMISAHEQPGLGAASPGRSACACPVNAKNAGRSRIVTRSCASARSVARRPALSCGMIAPSRNAPKIAWMPIASATSAESEQRDEQRQPPCRRRSAVRRTACRRAAPAAAGRRRT